MNPALIAEDAVWQISNTLGQVIIEQKANLTNSIQLGNIPSGLYFITLINQQRVVSTKQFIKL